MIPGGIWTHSLSRRAAADLRLRPRGHWDRQLSTPCLREFTYESKKDAEELNDVSVSDAVQTAEKGVDNSNAGTEDDASAVVHVDDDAERGTCGTPGTVFKTEIF